MRRAVVISIAALLALAVYTVAVVFGAVACAPRYPVEPGTVPIDRHSRAVLDRYMKLLECTYLGDAGGLASFDAADRDFAEQQVGVLRQSYTDHGSTINSVKVSYVPRSERISGGHVVVRALTSTKMRWIEHAYGESKEEESDWNDLHEIAFRMPTSGATGLGLSGDTLIDEYADAEEGDGRDTGGNAPQGPAMTEERYTGRNAAKGKPASDDGARTSPPVSSDGRS